MSITIMMVGCSSEQSNNQEVREKIEAYITESLEYEAGSYVKVNSQIVMRGSGELLSVETRQIKDYFTKQGSYIKTKLIRSSSDKKNDEEQVVKKGPITILLPEDFSLDESATFPSGEKLEEKEKEKVKQHILATFDEAF
ncbi:hypothetical protein [Pontibacillus yanchengensis]|uniref:Uncharacterized protein n=1 Tax=Pontibacillus yanchengensis Y32 TaxID=1385514 RepID=A0A0A2TCQ1_9BACI|nr:hypothetical protein [Pontibacillus yanchengensis]KGP73304.1 hypothetical protein N782_06480 [Pontibacillus yanchengensis Y32]